MRFTLAVAVAAAFAVALAFSCSAHAATVVVKNPVVAVQLGSPARFQSPCAGVLSVARPSAALAAGEPQTTLLVLCPGSGIELMVRGCASPAQWSRDAAGNLSVTCGA